MGKPLPQPKLKLKTHVACFLQELIEAEPPPDHPIFSIVMSQLGKLMVMVDTNPQFQATAIRMLNKVKETWHDETTLPPAP